MTARPTLKNASESLHHKGLHLSIVFRTNPQIMIAAPMNGSKAALAGDRRKQNPKHMARGSNAYFHQDKKVWSIIG